MQKLNLSALKKQPITSSPIVVAPASQDAIVEIHTSPVDPVETSTQGDEFTQEMLEISSENISSASFQAKNTNIIEEGKKGAISLRSEPSNLEEKIKGESSSLISITKEEVVPKKRMPSKEFFPNLGVETHLLDDLTGEKNSGVPSMIIKEETLDGRGGMITNTEDSVAIGADDTGTILVMSQEERDAPQEIPLSNTSSLLDDVDIPGVLHPVETTHMEGVTREQEIISSIPVLNDAVSSVKIAPIQDVGQIAKDLSAQRVGGLGVFVGKKKILFAASGVIMLAVASFAVLNFLPTNDIKTSVSESSPVAIDTPSTPNEPAVPTIPENPVDLDANNGILVGSGSIGETESSSGTLVKLDTATGAGETETESIPLVTASDPIMTETGTIITTTDVKETGTGEVIIATSTGEEVSSSTGGITSNSTGATFENTSSGSVLVQTEPTGSGSTEELDIPEKSFTGTRVINYRTPNPPRQKK